MSEVEKVRRFLSQDATIRVSSVVAPKLIIEAQKVNALSPIAVVAMGRAMLGCVLLASHQKDDRVSLLFDGNGALGKMFVEAGFDGKTRAYVSNPQAIVPLKNGLFDVSGAVGIGLLNVTRIQKYQKAPYRGTVIIKTGEVGDDIAFYLEQSHQIPSVVALSVQVDHNGLVKSAGGVLIELMPGYLESTVKHLEKNVSQVRPMAELLAEGTDAEGLARAFLGDIPLDEIEHDSTLSYSCTCSEERVRNSLILIGEQELEALQAQSEPIEVRCDFCGKHYYFSHLEIEELQKASHRRSMH